MSEPRIPINIRITVQTHKALTKLKQRSGATYQELVERAINELAEREKAAA